MIKENDNKIEEITLNTEDLNALNAMDELLSGGGGALIICSCRD